VRGRRAGSRVPGETGAGHRKHVAERRHGYFVADMKDSAAGSPVFNRTVTLRDSWGRTS
jgi:glutaminyl-tRNA synthetase